jgi:hypothetical protein
MRVGLVVAAASVLGLGLVPGLSVSVASQALGLDGAAAAGSGGIELVGLGASLHPGPLLVLALVLVVPVVAVSLVAARRRPRRDVDLSWGSGGIRVSPRMQYTATSYAEPLSRIFDDSLRPERDVVVTHSSEARYLVERIQYRQRLSDVFETRLYLPVINVIERVGMAAKNLQNGKINFYLAYSFVAFLVVLMVVSL